MKLILTRHGKTIENENGILQGHLPGNLSKAGIHQAKKLANRLKYDKIDAIYSSDLKRAADTAAEIAKYHPNAPIYYKKELRETDMGIFTGKDKKLIDWYNRPKEIESRESLVKRAKKVLDDIYKKYLDKTILLVGHNGINRAFVTLILNKPPEYMDYIEGNLNTSISIFEITKDKNHIIHALNCVDHLK